jgi:hypothetical protein
MQARQRSVEQLSRRITADARRPIWQPVGWVEPFAKPIIFANGN